MTEPAFDPTRQTLIWRPFPGFQERALAAVEDEQLAGGAKGPGKSDLVLVKPLKQVHRARFKGLVLRQTFKELRELLDRSFRYYGRLPERPSWSGDRSRWEWPSGASIEFGYCDALADTARYQGREWSYIGYDEVGNQKDPAVWTTLSAEVRSPDPEIRRYMFGTANPGRAGHPWLRKRFIVPCGADGARVAWERIPVGDGTAVYRSRRFIPGRVVDNPIYANDPVYMAALHALPDRLKRQLLYGDWDAADGLALEELDVRRHLVPAFQPPRHWPLFGSFDWGFAHPWVFLLWTVSEDGRLFVVDTAWGRRDRDDEILRKITSFLASHGLGPTDLQGVAAGHDNFRSKATPQKDNTPSRQERFAEDHLVLDHANIDRALGLSNLRHYLAWRAVGPQERDVVPMLQLMDTRGNRRGFEQLEGMVCDPDNPEDALKVDADPESGEGGDDFYDALRYGAASRPFAARGNLVDFTIQAWDRAVLAHEADRKRRGLAAHLDGDGEPTLADRTARAVGVDFGGLL